MGISVLARRTIFAGFVFALHFSAVAQGSLTPPGAPAPAMKSLDQIEARAAITNTTSLFAISQSGSYYLTHNLNVTNGDAIDITTNQVTLDLNGFTISSTAASANGTAIFLANADGNTEVTILNGHIKSGTTNNAGVFNGPGFLHGIYFNPAGTPNNIRVSGVSVSGCLSNGISVGLDNASVVESCTVRQAGLLGILADTVSHSTVLACGKFGIFATTVSDCKAEQFKSSGYGINAGTANNSTGNSNGTNAYGISANCANNCYGTSHGSGGVGLYAFAANNCFGYNYGNNGVALEASVANNCYANDLGGSVGGVGLDAGTAIGCYGSSSGIGVLAITANTCTVGGGTTNIVHKFNMP